MLFTFVLVCAAIILAPIAAFVAIALVPYALLIGFIIFLIFGSSGIGEKLLITALLIFIAYAFSSNNNDYEG